ncbi:MAG: carbon starvation protein CstA [Bacteroides sp. SM23_62_1]|nr:MAG: carbon starvation protein CstA [Bacteroides sp. SM23_62_1]
MNSLLLALLAFAGYILAYGTYGRFLGRRLFKLDDQASMPAHQYYDGVDYVPSKKHIIFGHHFTTIAGLGPIVGPAIGIIWGWLPAFIWVFLGSIFMGAVHDFSTLVVSARNQGKSIGDLTGDLISPGTRYVFQFIMQLLLFIVLSVFAMIVGVLFEMYPEAVVPVWMQIPIAVWLGWQIRNGKNDLVYSIIAVLFMYASIIAGVYLPVRVPPVFGSSVITWCILLFIYVFFASTIPVQKLLQPRDYINSHQLLVAMVLLMAGLIVAHPVITAPAVNSNAFAGDSDIPGLMPILFITIACGAVSGFHSLASSGTTVKQVDKENDTLFIGYGGMIWESFLAVLVLMAVAAGLGMGFEDNGKSYSGLEAFRHHYSSWAAFAGIDAKLEAFVVGASNLFNRLGLPTLFGKSLIAVFIVSFANTTIDSATRIQRLSLQEIFKDKTGRIRKPVHNRYAATFLVVLAATIMTFIKPGATGALILWPLFGSLNQLLAALALGVVSLYLYYKGKNILFTLIPMIFVLFVTIWAMLDNLLDFFYKDEYLLMGLSAVIIFLTAWLLVSGITALIKYRRNRITGINVSSTV